VKNKEQTIRIEFDEVLIAVGRIANTSGFGLENLDLPLTSRGNIAVNAAMQTAYPNIFACGDVASPHQFTHTASYQAFFASLNAMLSGFWRSNASDSIVPSATFTSPEIARVGLNEQQAKLLEVEYEITFFDMDNLDRALADGDAGGFIKILTQPRKDKILGVTIVGPHAGELIGEFIFAMTHGMGLKKISAVTHIYPTLSEANKIAANMWRNDRLPKKYLPLLKKFFRWRRGE
jgi:pyruvate/2-oxoglutarate dehydrogenase complex dihydrolipoamide dehydrogenase (E3) component